MGEAGAECRLLLLEPLAEPEVDALVDGLRETRSFRSACARILDAAEGNPLFVEQLLALQAESG